jgi:ADP-ribose pyrophosphatase
VTTPPILERRVDYRSRWLEVVIKHVELDEPRGREDFWAVRTASDYAAALAVTTEGRIPLVRLFRPALEEQVLELPSGQVDPGEDPVDAIRRELLEETGCEAGEIVSFGQLYTDSGRMETRQWAFYAPEVRVVRDGPVGDEPLELVFVEPRELGDLVRAGGFRHCPHLAVIAAAVLRGYVDL